MFPMTEYPGQAKYFFVYSKEKKEQLNHHGYPRERICISVYFLEIIHPFSEPPSSLGEEKTNVSTHEMTDSLENVHDI